MLSIDHEASEVSIEAPNTCCAVTTDTPELLGALVLMKLSAPLVNSKPRRNDSTTHSLTVVLAITTRVGCKVSSVPDVQ